MSLYDSYRDSTGNSKIILTMVRAKGISIAQCNIRRGSVISLIILSQQVG